jgi:hypothetical protein
MDDEARNMRTDASKAGPGGAGPAAAERKKGRLGPAMGWMLVLSLLLFWLPILGMFIAGLVGGRKAGSAGMAILAVLVPAAVVGLLMFFLATALTGMPILGAIAGFGAGVLVVANVVPMLVGAILGGILA